ncbi:hypothetical protein ANANG_G00143550 [Anguilla anguilla]|uniref:B30.2/SPRY domain-containing protein n=1 Tax=Anguilla anguilla TaxID=7936 RepID=A0A9D3RWM2_ANGAN|nr:hypothetical protein ANANG_G00143550 [Anguilla anguilla]
MDVTRHLGNLKFRVWEKMQSLVKFTPVTLDPNTANSCLTLSEDLTHMWVCDEARSLPDNPERDEYYQCALGSTGFCSGTHSWEVVVGDSTVWALGVAYHTTSRKGKPDLSPGGVLDNSSVRRDVHSADHALHTPRYRGETQNDRSPSELERGGGDFH